MTETLSAERMVAWLREAASELATAHIALDTLGGFPRINPASGNEFTLAARIAHGVQGHKRIDIGLGKAHIVNIDAADWGASE